MLYPVTHITPVADGSRYVHLRVYVLVARSVASGTCGGPRVEAVAIQHLVSAMASGDVDPHIVFAVFLDPTSIL
ncbi:MAG: hypothetical protein KBC83_00905 [Candidatus Moranbacteria bacterium]|jgi:hypothetical protein|nr:hypothetical protein [Candidatus Moranbacteria bacterium]MBP9801216.1 hypothetical protein [Candidatus Moranbacteria bacterium]